MRIDHGIPTNADVNESFKVYGEVVGLTSGTSGYLRALCSAGLRAVIEHDRSRVATHHSTNEVTGYDEDHQQDDPTHPRDAGRDLS